MSSIRIFFQIKNKKNVLTPKVMKVGKNKVIYSYGEHEWKARFLVQFLK